MTGIEMVPLMVVASGLLLLLARWINVPHPVLLVVSGFAAAMTLLWGITFSAQVH